MIFTPVPANEVEQAWPEIAQALWPVVRESATETMQSVQQALKNGHDLFLWASGDEGSGAIVLQITPEAVCWVKFFAGALNGGPRARLQTMRAAVEWIERAAKSAGCSEVRVCGRDWRVLLTSYELMPDAAEPNLLRKNLKEAA